MCGSSRGCLVLWSMAHAYLRPADAEPAGSLCWCWSPALHGQRCTGMPEPQAWYIRQPALSGRLTRWGQTSAGSLAGRVEGEGGQAAGGRRQPADAEHGARDALQHVGQAEQPWVRAAEGLREGGWRAGLQRVRHTQPSAAGRWPGPQAERSAQAERGRQRAGAPASSSARGVLTGLYMKWIRPWGTTKALLVVA